MQSVDCATCKNKQGCPLLGRQHLATMRAELDGRDAPACPQWRPAYWRGVPGVFPHAPAARPS